MVFDRYDMHKSLKIDMRERRQGSKPAITYHITDTTNIAKIEMTRILSHVKTKSELTNYREDTCKGSCTKEADDCFLVDTVPSYS